MYRIETQLSNVINFKFLSEHLIIAKANNSILIDNQELYMQEPHDIFTLSKSECVITSNIDSKGIYYNFKTSDKKEFLGGQKMLIYVDGNKKYAIIRPMDSSSESLYSICNETIIYTLFEQLGGVIFNNYIIGKRKSVVFGRHVSSPKKLWEFDVKSLGTYTVRGIQMGTMEEYNMKLKRIVGLYDGILWLSMKSGMILGLDIKTGKELQRCTFDDRVYVQNNIELDTEKGVIFSMGSQHYLEYEIDSNKSTFYEIHHNKILESIEVATWDKNLIFYYYSKHEPDFGIFDRESKKVIWEGKTPNFYGPFDCSGNTCGCNDEKKLAEEGILTGVQDIKYHEGKIYVLDSTHTLNVYEKE